MSTELAIAGNEITAMIEQSDLADSTKMKYKRAVNAYLATGASLADSEALAAYAQTVSVSTRSFLKAAIALWASAMATQVKRQSTPETVDAVTATLHRLDALNEAIKVKQSKGTKTHTWLSQSQIRRLFHVLDQTTMEGQRNRLVLGLLAGAGLRRQELANLQWSDIKYQPAGDKMRTVLAIRGKGAKDRTVPISDRLAAALDSWQTVTGASGYVVRSLGVNKELGERISDVAIFHIVRKVGQSIGKPGLAPHDLRRTYAQLGYEAGIPITQISRLLGHSSVSTTQKYLNLDLDLNVTASDFVPFE